MEFANVAFTGGALSDSVLCGSLAWVRITAMLFTAPVLGNKSIPFRFKVLLSIVLTTVAFPLINQTGSLAVEIDQWPTAALGELTIGIFLGLGVKVVFAAAQMAGTVISQMAAIQMGAGEQMEGAGGTPVSQLFGVLSVAAFVLMSGPEYLVGATLDTFVAVPIGSELALDNLSSLLIELLRQSFLLTLRGVAPAVTAMLISTIVIGLVARNFPQINLLNLGLTSNLCVMFLALFFTLGGCVWLFADDFHQVLATIQDALAGQSAIANADAGGLR